MAKNVTRDTERLQMMQSNNKELNSANKQLNSAVLRMESLISRLKHKKIHGKLIDLVAPAPMEMSAADLISSH